MSEYDNFETVFRVTLDGNEGDEPVHIEDLANTVEEAIDNGVELIEVAPWGRIDVERGLLMYVNDSDDVPGTLVEASSDAYDELEQQLRKVCVETDVLGTIGLVVDASDGEWKSVYDLDRYGGAVMVYPKQYV